MLYLQEIFALCFNNYSCGNFCLRINISLYICHILKETYAFIQNDKTIYFPICAILAYNFFLGKMHLHCICIYLHLERNLLNSIRSIQILTKVTTVIFATKTIEKFANDVIKLKCIFIANDSNV